LARGDPEDTQPVDIFGHVLLPVFRLEVGANPAHPKVAEQHALCDTVSSSIVSFGAVRKRRVPCVTGAALPRSREGGCTGGASSRRPKARARSVDVVAVTNSERCLCLATNSEAIGVSQLRQQLELFRLVWDIDRRIPNA
jgi:hypothetical protein